ncbi:MAG: DUF3267 domain-containing protein [Ruminococcaceae bacterium]|nr:DUF3267 domain-containing protein [Oscillospiraceae bacterium]
MRRAFLELPEGYRLYRTIDLAKDRRLARKVALLSLGIAGVMLVLALPLVPFSTFFDFRHPSTADGVRLLLLLPAMFLYVLTHEWIHGIYMKKYSGVRPKYGFSGMYAYAGSPAFFPRRIYLLIALAPVILWGGILLILNLALPTSCFWFVYLLQILNLSGAAGDFYVSTVFSRLPPGLLVRDDGVRMELYLRMQKAKTPQSE